jgi:hypothetical protein
LLTRAILIPALAKVRLLIIRLPTLSNVGESGTATHNSSDGAFELETMTCPIAEGKGGGAPSFDWLQRTAFALSLYVLAIAPEPNVKPMNGSDPKAVAFKAVRASPFVFEVLGIAFVRSQKAPDVEDGPLLNPSPRMFMCCDANVRSVYCNMTSG